MPRTKRLSLAPEEIAAKRSLILAWMREHDHDYASFAAFLDYSPSGVRVNLGDPALKTQRDPAFDFLRRVQERTGLELLGPVADRVTPAGEKLDELLVERVVVFLALTGIASARQLAELCGRTVSTFNRWAPELVSLGLLAQVSEKQAGHGAVRHLYALGRAGARRASRMVGRTVTSPVAQGHLKAEIPVRHNLNVTEIALRAYLDLGPKLVDWAADAACRARLTRLPGRQFAEPDLVLVFRDDQGDHACWVEFETGTAGYQAVVDKVAAVDAYYRGGNLQRDWLTHRLRVLWVCGEDGHATQVREWVGPARPYVHHWFTGLAAVRQHGLAGRIWQVVNGRERRFGLLDQTGLPGFDVTPADDDANRVAP
jgi:hypothetical protein